MPAYTRPMNQCGFTLVELAIVMVIIGLIIGGVLVGRDLISAAGTRSVITQIEKYKSAANAFREKYHGLPGDISPEKATAYGFTVRAGNSGRGDENGEIEGNFTGGVGGNTGFVADGGESGLFWRDLSDANMVDGSFNTATDTVPLGVTTPDLYYPAAKIGRGNYIYTWSGSPTMNGAPGVSDHKNYFSISAVTHMNTWITYSQPGLYVYEAYNIDLKIDDGVPQRGKVQAFYLRDAGGTAWAAKGGIGVRDFVTNGPSDSWGPPNDDTCYDNNNSNGVPQHYSMGVQSGNGLNCALSFQY